MDILTSNGIVVFWIAAIVVFLIVEALTVGLTSIWFALGGLAALICALLGGPLWLQILWFLVIAIATLLLTRPLVRKYVNARRQPTNADRSIGEIAVVTEEIDNIAGTGAVSLEGKFWTARSVSGEVFHPGEKVRVREIRGVKLLVENAAAPAAVPDKEEN